MSCFKIALSLTLLVLSKADFPFNYYGEIEEVPSELVSTRSEEQVYRLPTNVIPLAYDIYIDLFFGERTEKPFSYEGRESILIQVVEENVNEIVLHANVDSIDEVTLFTETGTEITINRFYTEPQYHFLKISLETSLIVNGNYTLNIRYSKTMNDGPMKRGIWKGWYTDADGVERIYATTHFQPYNARQAFPCWDEPLFKAEFTLHLSRPINYSKTFSNTALRPSDELITGDRAIDHFYPSPKMSSYLVTFLVSETFQVIAENTTFQPPIRIIGRSNTAGLGGTALELAVQLTKYFDDYFGIPYSSLHPHLLNDHIASPDWASAGTENWGMVSYRELHLIIDSQVTTMSVEHYGVTLVSHELAHKWFGNLITCYWWSNTWINEGYASYFGYMAAHQMFPRYELHEHFNSRYLQNSLSFDSGTGTVPMNHDVNTPAQVTGHFGTISYSKAAAFLRMTENMITPDTFRKSCQFFLKNNPYKAPDQYDLFKAFDDAVSEDGTLSEYPQFNFTEYYDVWVNQPGYPILIVDVNHSNGEMTLRQERFFVNTAPPTGQIYPIPITYSTSRNRNFAQLKPSHMMNTEQMVLQKDSGEEWVIFNHQQQAHYRVTYDDRTWNLITEALGNDPNVIHHLNRAQVVDDVFALMRSTRMSHSQGFRILRFLRNEDNYHVWSPAISGFTWIRNRLRHLPDSLAEFDSIILSHMNHVINEVGFEPTSNETPTVSMLRQEVLQFACNLGHEKCIEESVRRFVDMRDNVAVVDRRIRRNVYMNGIREGGQQDFGFLLSRFSLSNIANDQLEMLRALGATKDPLLLTGYLQLTLTRNVRSHDKATSFNYALLGHQNNAATVLEFVKNHIDAMRIEYVEDAPPTPVHTALSNLASNLDEAGLADFEEWLHRTQSGTAQYNSALSSIGSARSNIEWANANAESILSAARDGAATAAVSVLLITISAMIVSIV